MRWLRTALLSLALVLHVPGACASAPVLLELGRLLKAGDTEQFKRQLATKRPNDINVAGRSGLMVLAISGKNAEAVGALLDWGVDANCAVLLPGQENPMQSTPLVYAIGGRAGVPVMATLLDHGASPNQPSEGLVPLNFAISLRQYDVANHLIDRGADAHLVDRLLPTTPLMDLAISADDEDPAVLPLARRLIAAGADVNARARGASALRFAVMNSRKRLVQQLLDSHADPNDSNDKGETVLQLAKRKGLSDISAMLERAGAKR